MSKTSIPFFAEDITAVARSLRNHLGQGDCLPGHLELLNLLARSAGHRNFQSLRAQALAPVRPIQSPADALVVKQAARYFDPEGRLLRWPSRTQLREVCLWLLWSKLPAKCALTEDGLNIILRANHRFADHALLRRELCDRGLVTRTPDGREYRRVERRPTPEAMAVLELHRLAKERV